MKKKILIVISLLLSIPLLTVSCSLIKGGGMGGGIPGSGNVQTGTRDVGAFESISMEYPGAEIVVEQGEKEKVDIKADDNLLPQLSTDAISGRLTIKNLETDWNASVNPSKPVKIKITVRKLKEIVLSAPVGNLDVNDFHSGTLRLVVSGGAQVNLNGIQVDLLDIDLSGAGDIQANGTAEEIKLILSGVGSFNAANLKSNKATIELSGMGSATVRVENDLAATLTGAGSIKYFGDPRVEQHVTGAGSVEPAE